MVPMKYVYTSSTSVYGQTDGSVVNEASPAIAQSPNAQVLLEAERLLLAEYDASKFPAIILRVAGIYGPGRGHLFDQFVRGEARLDAVGKRVINMIHRDDLIDAIIAVLEYSPPGVLYNVVDDEPVTQIEFLSWLARSLIDHRHQRWLRELYESVETPANGCRMLF
jgi:nucleoside-diphosphate-sugar epimerase